jgi:hypothetical protein
MGPYTTINGRVDVSGSEIEYALLADFEREGRSSGDFPIRACLWTMRNV